MKYQIESNLSILFIFTMLKYRQPVQDDRTSERREKHDGRCDN